MCTCAFRKWNNIRSADGIYPSVPRGLTDRLCIREEEEMGESLIPTVLITPTQRDTEKWCRAIYFLQRPDRAVQATMGGCQILSKKYQYNKISMSYFKAHAMTQMEPISETQNPSLGEITEVSCKALCDLYVEKRTSTSCAAT